MGGLISFINLRHAGNIFIIMIVYLETLDSAFEKRVYKCTIGSPQT